MRSEQQNTNSEGENRHFEGDFRYCVVTVCSQLNIVLSFNCRGLTALNVTPWLRARRSTQGERGV